MTGPDADGGGVFETSASRNPRYTAAFDDDGEVAYGYMLRDGKIVSDVWLYNSGETPRDWPWLAPADELPYPNPVDFADLKGFAPVSTGDDVSFVWSYGHGDVPVAVEFWIRGKLHARITPDSKPGWCVLARKDGPLARRLV
ncbi:MAG TPA: hypothetical protein VGF43_07705 [Dongiaceae bacterium]|jgi:hypothetical protein